MSIDGLYLIWPETLDSRYRRTDIPEARRATAVIRQLHAEASIQHARIRATHGYSGGIGFTGGYGNCVQKPRGSERIALGVPAVALAQLNGMKQISDTPGKDLPLAQNAFPLHAMGKLEETAQFKCAWAPT